MEQISDGEEFRQWLEEEASSRAGVRLEKRIVEDAPLPTMLSDRDINEFFLQFNNGKQLAIQIPPPTSTDLICEGLAVAYGYKQVKHDYSLRCFKELEQSQLDLYKRLALEIWDRNIHLAWMRSNNYLIHNGTKDIQFCKLMAGNLDERKKGVVRHRQDSSERKDIDSPHHSITYSQFEEVLAAGTPRSLVIEAFYDQASVCGRWYNKAKKYELSHGEMQAAVKDKGPLFVIGDEMKFWTYDDYTSRNGDVPNAAAAWDD